MKITSTVSKLFLISCYLANTAYATTGSAESTPQMNQMMKYLKEHHLLADDAEISVQSKLIGFENCNDLQYDLIPEKHSDSALRLLAECHSPSAWKQLVNIKITAKQDYFVTLRSFKRGESLKASDLKQHHDPLYPPISNLMTHLDDLTDKTAAHDIKTGTILRKNDLSEALLVRRNERVKIINTHDGFSITSFGKALNNGAKHQVVKIQLDNKQFISGRVESTGTVEVKK